MIMNFDLFSLVRGPESHFDSEIFSLSGAILQLAEQEKYELQMRLDAKLSMEEWYNEEITHLRNQQAEGHDNLRQTLESEKHMEVSKLTRQVDCFYFIEVYK